MVLAESALGQPRLRGHDARVTRIRWCCSAWAAIGVGLSFACHPRVPSPQPFETASEEEASVAIVSGTLYYQWPGRPTCAWDLATLAALPSPAAAAPLRIGGGGSELWGIGQGGWL